MIVSHKQILDGSHNIMSNNWLFDEMCDMKFSWYAFPVKVDDSDLYNA